MPEYLGPGVFVEETSFRTRAIEGVATGTAGFVGPAAAGHSCGPPELLTSFAEFERNHGGLEPLVIRGAPVANHLAHAARAFFAEGGRRLYVATFAPDTASALAGYETALAALAEVEEVSLVAAPASTGSAYKPRKAAAIQAALVAHCQRQRYRMAILDTPAGFDDAQTLAWRGRFDSSRAALYSPWLRTTDPAGGALLLPPSGFVAGIIARNDLEQGVHQAPANQPLRSVTGLEVSYTHAQQELLNPAGVNLIREFPGRGIRVWGARTASSEPEWKYVNVRRYFIYLERSIERGTQWVVFEPNGESLWASVRGTVEDFLYNEWRDGCLQGSKPEQAFFVRCDRSTMTQADLDAGRLICEIGIAFLKPAEFVIFRIGQATADAQA